MYKSANSIHLLAPRQSSGVMLLNETLQLLDECNQSFRPVRMHTSLLHHTIEIEHCAIKHVLDKRSWRRCLHMYEYEAVSV